MGHTAATVWSSRYESCSIFRDCSTVRDTAPTVNLRIATRRSPLALWQARRVAEDLEAVDSSITTELIAMDTFADRRLDLPISELGGKGAFSKEVQNVLFAGEADCSSSRGAMG